MLSRIRPHRCVTLPLATLALLSTAPPALATNGYFAHGYSASQRAMGGAGTALTEDALIVTINPAGSAWVQDRLDVNLSWFTPIRDYESGPVGAGAENSILRIEEGGLRSKNERFFIPGLAYTRRLDEVSSWGIAVYGNGGLNTEYHGNTAHFGEGFAVGLAGLNLISLETQCEGSFGGGPALAGETDTAGFCGENPDVGVDLIQLFVMPHYARKLGLRTSIGIAPILAGQRFRADGLDAFRQFSNHPGQVSGRGYDHAFGYGGRVGFLTGALPGFGFGASYQTRIRMSAFDKYSGLFADGGDFDIPSSWNVGLSVHPSDRLRLAVDFQRIHFNEVRAVGNPFDTNDFVNQCARPRLLAALGFGGSTAASPACLGAATGPGFGWQDVDVLKFGAQLRLERLALRAGYSKNNQPIPEGEILFNILAPAVPEEHYTAGASLRLTPTLALDLALMVAKSNPVIGKNPLSNTDATALDLVFGAPSNATAFGIDANDQDIRLNMRQWEATIGLSFFFD